MKKIDQDAYFDCTPLAARITFRQCAVNRKRAKQMQYPGWLRPCLKCKENKVAIDVKPQPEPEDTDRAPVQVRELQAILRGARERDRRRSQMPVFQPPVPTLGRTEQKKPATTDLKPFKPALTGPEFRITSPEIEGGGGTFPTRRKTGHTANTAAQAALLTGSHAYLRHGHRKAA